MKQNKGQEKTGHQIWFLKTELARALDRVAMLEQFMKCLSDNMTQEQLVKAALQYTSSLTPNKEQIATAGAPEQEERSK